MRKLTENELSILRLFREHEKLSAGDVRDLLELEGIRIPYTTISSALDRMHREGILKKEEAKSRGKYGKKYIYSVNPEVLSDEKSSSISEFLKKILFSGDYIHSADSVAFIDSEGIVVFVYGNGKIINDKKVIGKEVEELHKKVTAKFVRKIFDDLKNRKRDFFVRKVMYNGKELEKLYIAVRSSRDEFLGVLVITREEGELRKLPDELIYP